MADRLYTLAGVNRTFDMGLESAIYVLEKSLGLSRAGQWLINESLKKDISRGTSRVPVGSEINLIPFEVLLVGEF